MSGRREHYPDDRPRASTVRSRLMLEVASELVGLGEFRPKQARISFREQGADSWEMAIFGSDALSAGLEVASGATDFAIVNPAAVATRALRGLEPFREPVPLRAVATIPSYDQLGIAIADELNITTLIDLATRRPALRVSLRGERPDHSVHTMLTDVLVACGLSPNAFEEWGGVVAYHPGIPDRGERLEAIRAGEVDLIVDEGIYNWVDLAIESGFRFLSIPDGALDALEALGYSRSTISSADYDLLVDDVTTLNFSGFLIYTHERVADDVVTAFCHAMDVRQERIPWQGGPSLPLSRMVVNADDAPVPIPFHPAAEAYWRGNGYLS